MVTLYTLLRSFWYLFFQGISMTLIMWMTSMMLSCFIGIPIGIFSCNMLKKNRINWFIGLYVFLVRAVPVYVHVLIVYFVIPELFSISLSPFIAAWCALGICSSGYMAEIIRSGINAIPQEQWDAALVLGYSRFQTVRYIILPQTVRCIVPALFNECESLVKSTSIVSAIGVVELTKIGSNLVARTLQPIPIYLLLALAYVCISLLLNAIRALVKARFSYVEN